MRRELLATRLDVPHEYLGCLGGIDVRWSLQLLVSLDDSSLVSWKRGAHVEFSILLGGFPALAGYASHLLTTRKDILLRRILESTTKT